MANRTKTISFQVTPAEERMLGTIVREFERQLGTGRKITRSDALRGLVSGEYARLLGRLRTAAVKEDK